ncbi:MAG: PstS family phosphate ABC transporter substrate-binding protein [Crocosphaera sp.]|nr:PstS family phosphate ABC transporter substrate-binding protein [Crocosphaera sp.]
MITNIKQIFKVRNWGMAIVSLSLLSACGTVRESAIEPIKLDGSSTVYPITEGILETYKKEAKKASIKELTIEGEFSGTGGGFNKFCAGETDVNAASRPISAEEIKACGDNEIRYVELPIAFDAITIVVNPNNNWVENLTVQQLQQIWEPAAENQIKKWNQIDPTYPSNPLTLYGPDELSGTYDYFTKAIVGKTGKSRQDYVKSEDDEVLVTGVMQDPNAIGYFGYGYYQQHKEHLKAVAVNNGNGEVIPSRETVENEQYKPLSRPLFLYVNAKRAQENPALEIFVEYYLDKAPEVVVEAGYIPLPPDAYHVAKVNLQQFDVGTVFEGGPQIDISISDLMRKPAKF